MSVAADDLSWFGTAMPSAPSYAGPQLTTAIDLSPAEQFARDDIQNYLFAISDAATDAVSLRQPTLHYDVIKRCKRFIDTLVSLRLPVPEASVTASRNLSFDWDDDPQNQLTIILQSDGRISYAAYFSGDRVHGIANSKGGRFPEELLAAIQKWRNRTARQDVAVSAH